MELVRDKQIEPGRGKDLNSKEKKKGSVDRTELLKQNPLFSGLDEVGLRQVRGITSLRSFNKGDGLFFQGERADGFYLVLAGRIKIFRLSPQGQEYVMRIAGPGETIAEAAVFSGKTYPASAEALEDSRLYYLKKEDFLSLIQGRPQMALNMMTGLSLLLRQLAQQVEDLSLKEVSARLARFLIGEAQKISPFPADGLKIFLEMKKNLLASRLGTIGETLSRTLTKMKQKEIIDIDKDLIVIRNFQALRAVSEGSKL
jgi:CRP/FNR family transcriptional regulator, dissimilatory nitrate respiration regulator